MNESNKNPNNPPTINFKRLTVRSALAATPLICGLVLVWGNPSLMDRMFRQFDPLLVVLVTVTLVSFFIALALWVLCGSRSARMVVGICAIGFLSSLRAEAWIGETLPEVRAAQVSGVRVVQDFSLPAAQQAEVDAAIEKVVAAAKNGFVISVELAMGLFIGAVIVGTVLTIIVRIICKALDSLQQKLTNRVERVELNRESRAAALFAFGTTTNGLPSGTGFSVDFITPPAGEPVTPRGYFPTETMPFNECLGLFALDEALPLETKSPPGTASIAREGDGYLVQPAGFTNLVTLVIERATEVGGAWKRVLKLRVPQGARVNFSDETALPAAAFWRVCEDP